MAQRKYVRIQRKAMDKVLIECEWGRIALLPDGRPVKEVVVKQIEVEMAHGLGTAVSVAAGGGLCEGVLW